MRFYKTKKVSEMIVASLSIFLTFILLTHGCVQEQPISKGGQEQPIGEEEIECDALTRCSEGYECVKLPDKSKPVCVSPDVLKSDKYKNCAVAESYPVQLICPQARIRGDGCESDSDCKISGCNGEICSEQEGMASICVYKPEFECYSLTNCKCINGKCGWEQTEEFLDCVTSNK